MDFGSTSGRVLVFVGGILSTVVAGLILNALTNATVPDDTHLYAEVTAVPFVAPWQELDSIVEDNQKAIEKIRDQNRFGDPFYKSLGQLTDVDNAVRQSERHIVGLLKNSKYLLVFKISNSGPKPARDVILILPHIDAYQIDNGNLRYVDADQVTIHLGSVDQGKLLQVNAWTLADVTTRFHYWGDDIHLNYANGLGTVYGRNVVEGFSSWIQRLEVRESIWYFVFMLGPLFFILVFVSVIFAGVIAAVSSVMNK